MKALACERAHEPRPHHREALAVDAEPRGEISRFVGRRDHALSVARRERTDDRENRRRWKANPRRLGADDTIGSEGDTRGASGMPTQIDHLILNVSDAGASISPSR